MTTVGVVGASARAAVHSLARAGYRAWAVDQFADRDLKCVAACAVCPPDRYPDALPELAAQFPPGPVLYTGGLENYPHIVAELASQRELWGNPPDVLAKVRNPITLFPTLAASGFATPRLVPPGEPCPYEGRWLRKPLRSGGGIGIRFAQPNEPASPPHYFAEFIDGPAMSVVYFGSDILGVTQQLIGESWLHAAPFAYCGNIGPIDVPAPPAFPIGLRGVWGLDFILDGDVPYPIEVNPRYTAAVEVLEHSVGKSLPPHPPSLKGRGKSSPSPLAGEGSERSERVRGVTLAYPQSDPSPVGEAPPPYSPARGEGQNAGSPFPLGRGVGGVGSSTVGKAIYYAPHAFHFPDSGPWDADLAGEFDPWRLPRFADIPEAGSVIQAGWPVLTFFATGTTPAEVRERLQSRAAELDDLFRSSQL